MANHERTSFYVGISNDISRRTIEHMYGYGCEFSRKYKTVDLLYYEHYQYNDEAIAREKQLKGWRRDKKISLVKTINPDLEKINQQLFIDYGYTEKDIKEILGLLIEKYGVRL